MIKNKIKTIIIGILSIHCLFLLAPLANAADDIYFEPNVSIPGSQFTYGEQIKVTNTTGNICEYIKAIYEYAIGIIGILGALGIAIGGVIWATAGGNQSTIGEARTWIISSLLGIAVALSAFLILATVNSDLVVCYTYSIPGIKGGTNNSSGSQDMPDTAKRNTITIAVDISDKAGKITKKNITIDKSVDAKKLQDMFTQIADLKFPIHSIGSLGHFDNPKSCHYLGFALDINATENYCVTKSRTKAGEYYRPKNTGLEYYIDKNKKQETYDIDPYSVTKQVVDIFTSNGWGWGGDWLSLKDYMHFTAPQCPNTSERSKQNQYRWDETVQSNHKGKYLYLP